MRVLMLGPARNVNGGISAVVNNYYKAGLDKKVELEYVKTMEDGSRWHKLRIALAAYVRFAVKVGKYEIIHIHMASDVSIYRKLPFIWLSRLYGKKIMIHQHGGNIRHFYECECGKVRKWIIKATLRKADAFLVVAPYLKEVFSNIVETEKIIVLPNAVEVPKVSNHDYEKQNILFLGRLCQEKGIYELLDAVKDLKPEFPNLQLYLGGVWEDEELEKKAKLQQDFVHYLGWVGLEKKERCLQECNIFVLPTYFEGLPMSLLEGMAYGCACVATNVGGIPQVITERNDGLLISARDVSALKEALRELLMDSSLQKELGVNAVETIREKYELHTSVKKLIQIYKDTGIVEVHST